MAGGFSINANQITYRGTPLKWAMLARAMNAVNTDAIENDLERAFFELWREAVQTAVESSFAQSWMDERQIDNANSDAQEYLPAA